MLKKLLQVYENQILKERTKKNLTWIGWLYIVISGIIFMSFAVLAFFHFYYQAIAAILIFLIGTVILGNVANKQIKDNEESLKQFKDKKIEKLKNILNESELGSKEVISVIISQCKEYEASKDPSFFGDNFKSVFEMLIYPIVTTIVAIISNNITEQDRLEGLILIIGIIISIYILIAVIKPIILESINKYKIISKMMRNDLEYILALENQKKDSKIII